MGWGDYLIIAAVILCCVGALYLAFRRKKNGKGCCGSCASCPYDCRERREKQPPKQ